MFDQPEGSVPRSDLAASPARPLAVGEDQPAGKNGFDPVERSGSDLAGDVPPSSRVLWVRPDPFTLVAVVETGTGSLQQHLSRWCERLSRGEGALWGSFTGSVVHTLFFSPCIFSRLKLL